MLRIIGFVLLSLALVGFIAALTNSDEMAATTPALALQHSRVEIWPYTREAECPNPSDGIPRGCEAFANAWKEWHDALARKEARDQAPENSPVPRFFPISDLEVLEAGEPSHVYHRTRHVIDARLGDVVTALAAVGLVGLGLLLFGGTARRPKS